MLWPKMTEGDRLALVDKTWEELGHKVRAIRYMTWVRTLPFPEKTAGGILLPPKLQSFHGELPHLQNVRGVVVSTGPVGAARDMKVGELVEFQRLHFAYYKKLREGDGEEYVGYGS